MTGLQTKPYSLQNLSNLSELILLNEHSKLRSASTQRTCTTLRTGRPISRLPHRRIGLPWELFKGPSVPPVNSQRRRIPRPLAVEAASAFALALFNDHNRAL